MTWHAGGLSIGMPLLALLAPEKSLEIFRAVRVYQVR